MRVRVACNGHHRLFKPIRPIALTFCDVIALARENRFLATGLLIIAGLLLFGAHLTAARLQSDSIDLVYSAVKTYLSRKATGIAYQGILQLVLTNGAFFLFRFLVYVALYVFYELGKNVVFALSLLLTLVLALVLFALLAFGQEQGNSDTKVKFAAAAFGSSAVLGWYWFRYMSSRNPNHKSFDFEVGAALVRLRSF